EVENRVHPGLTALTGKFLFDLVAVNRVHDDDVIRTIVAQERRRHNFLPGTRQKFADAVRIDVDRVLNLVMYPKRRQKSDGLRSGAPKDGALPGSSPIAEPGQPCCTATRRGDGKAAGAVDDSHDIIFISRRDLRSVLRGFRQNHQVLAIVTGPRPLYRETRPSKQALERGGAKIKTMFVIDIPKCPFL